MSGTPSSEPTFREGDRCGGCGYWWWDDHGPSGGGKGWHSLVPISYADHRDEARLVCCPACEEVALVSGFPYDRDTPTEAREGDQFRDLDPREVKKGRWVEVESVNGDFAYCVAFPSQRGVRIHLSRLTNPRLFEKVEDDDARRFGVQEARHDD